MPLTVRLLTCTPFTNIRTSYKVPYTHRMKAFVTALACAAALLPCTALAQDWSQPVRGSWVQAGGPAQAGDVTLAGNGSGCEIVVGGEEHSAVKQAAVFLAADIEWISGYKPPIVSQPSGRRVAVRLVTRPDGKCANTTVDLSLTKI